MGEFNKGKRVQTSIQEKDRKKIERHGEKEIEKKRDRKAKE